MNYRKAMKCDVEGISKLVTDLIGTCNINSSKTILESNIEEITKDIEKYYVCIEADKIVGACGISDIQNYKAHKYCQKCVNRNKECNKCWAQIWIKYKEI